MTYKLKLNKTKVLVLQNIIKYATLRTKELTKDCSQKDLENLMELTMELGTIAKQIQENKQTKTEITMTVTEETNNALHILFQFVITNNLREYVQSLSEQNTDELLALLKEITTEEHALGWCKSKNCKYKK